MAFINDSEYIILMDHAKANNCLYSNEELMMLKDAGIQTALSMPMDWNNFVHNGHWMAFDWGYFDSYLERLDKVGMKCILHLWFKQYSHFPESWYVKSFGKVFRDLLSPWCRPAQDINLEVLRTIKDKYASDKVIVASAQCQGGERILLNEACYFDDFAVKDWHDHGYTGQPNHARAQSWLKECYLRTVMEQQNILIEQPTREIWFMLAYYKNFAISGAAHGCQFFDDYMAFYKSLNPTSINHISFNYFVYNPGFWNMWDGYCKKWGINEFPGAEYCEGLKYGAVSWIDKKKSEPTGQIAVQRGLRGMLIHPCSPLEHSDHVRLMPWMVKEIAETHKAFEKARREK